MKIFNDDGLQEYDKAEEKIWQTKRPETKIKRGKLFSMFGTLAIGTLAIGTLAIGTLAIGTLAIGTLTVAGCLSYLFFSDNNDLQKSIKLISYPYYLSLKTLQQDLLCRYAFWKSGRINIDPRTANNIYSLKLASLANTIRYRSKEKIFIATQNSSLSFWFLHFRVEEQITLLDEYGNVRKDRIKSLCKLGNLRVFKKRQRKIQTREKEFEQIYQAMQKDRKNTQSGFVNNCRIVNITNKLWQNSQKYNELVSECQQSTTNHLKHILELMDARNREEAKLGLDKS